MIKANNKIAANWIKISTDLQSQLIASEEDKIKLLAEIASLTGEIKRLRGILRRVTPDPVWGEDPRTKSYYLEARAALQPKEVEG